MENTTNPLLADIDGIIFDYGGTLDSHADHWSHIIYDGWRHAGLDIALPLFRDAYVHAERQLARQRIVLPCDNFFELMRKKVAIELEYPDIAAHLGNADTVALADNIARYCYDAARASVNDARPVLEALSTRVPLVLVSNFYGNIDEVLRDFDLRRYFSGIIESAVVGIRKPDPRIFTLGVVALGITPDRVLVVGDSLKKDILPARAADCHTAWIKGRGWTADEDAATDPAQIPSLDALRP